MEGLRSTGLPRLVMIDINLDSLQQFHISWVLDIGCNHGGNILLNVIFLPLIVQASERLKGYGEDHQQVNDVNMNLFVKQPGVSYYLYSDPLINILVTLIVTIIFFLQLF